MLVFLIKMIIFANIKLVVIMRRQVLFAFLLVAASITAQSTDETIVFTPQWMAQAQFTGYYVAEVKGFYREAGVKVKIEHPSSTQPAMSRLRNNLCQATPLQLCQGICHSAMPVITRLSSEEANIMVTSLICYRTSPSASCLDCSFRARK